MGKPDAASLIQSALDLLARDGSPDGFRSRRAVEALITAETGENAEKKMVLLSGPCDLGGSFRSWLALARCCPWHRR